jgi:hypothetical protein
MDAVQRLRQKAFAQGNLATTAQQVIRVESQTQIIIIQPASPEVVYVPVYDTAIIYGRWWYPGYPPYHFYPVRYSGISFFSGVFVVTFWGAWGSWDCNWHNHHVYVNLNHYNNFTRTYYRSGDHYRFYQYGQDHEPWRYDPRHRQTTRYRSTLTAKLNAPVLRENRQVTVRPPASVTKEAPRPVINSITKSPSTQTSSKKMPAAVLKEALAKRAKIRPSVKADVRSKVEKPKSAEIVTRDFRVQEVTTYSTVKNNVKGDKKNQAIKRQPASNSRPKEDDTGVLAAIVKEKGRQATKYKLPLNQPVLSTLKGSGVLREDLKFVPRTDYGMRSR